MTVQGVQESDIRTLEPGVTVEGELARDAKHQYRIALAAEQYVSFRIAKKGLTVNLTLNDAKGESLFSGTLEAREQGTEVLSLVARTAGLHTLIIKPNFENAPLGSYRLTADELRVATDQDRQRFAAQQNVADADRLFSEGTPQSRLESLEKLSATLGTSRALGDRVLEAGVLKRKGLTHMWEREFEKAYEHLNQALELSRAERDVSGEAETLRAIGMVKSAEVKYQDAIKYFEQSAALLKGSAERWQLAITNIQLGTTYWRLGKREELNRYFDEALRGLHEVGDVRNEAGTRTNLGFIHLAAGVYQEALDDLLPSLKIFRAMKDEYGEAVALNNLGKIYYNLGALQKSLQYFEQSLALAKAAKDLDYGAAMLTNMGDTYGTLGDKQRALTLFEDALKSARKSRNARSESNALDRIGKVYLEMGELPKALKNLNERLALTRKQSDPAGEAETRTSIGEVYAARGDDLKALEELNGALGLRRRVRDRHGEAATLYALATVERHRRRFSEARTHIDSAIKIIESLRAKVTGDELRISYLAAHQAYYEFYIDLLMRLHAQDPAAGHSTAALLVSERARARALLESLAEARVDIRAGVSPELLESEHSLGRQLNAREERRIRELSGKPTKSDIEKSDREVEALIDQFNLVRAQIRAASPRYAALTQPQPLDLKQIQSQLDDKTLLLVYSLGEERSFLFAVTPTSFQTYVLPKRKLIENEAAAVYTLVKDDEVRASENRGGEAVVSDRGGLKERRLLSQRLLGPVAGKLAGKRLAIVADGKLQYVPFAALPEPGQEQLLVAGHEIVNLPSVSVLEQLRGELARRSPAPKSIIIFADPVYSLQDERFKNNGGKSSPSNPDPPVKPIDPALEGLGLNGLPRLPASEDEANEISKLFPPSTSSIILGFDASLATLDRTDLSQFQILHFATHGQLNSQNPELSGVVLSLYNKESHEQDGFLHAHRIYNLKLGADLVVLSACETALGKEVRGEGLMGVTRAFMYAGAPRVVVSLWKVDDAPTAELMKHFYQGMRREKLSPAAALRAAQATMARTEGWDAPVNWAGFILQGDWR